MWHMPLSKRNNLVSFALCEGEEGEKKKNQKKKTLFHVMSWNGDQKGSETQEAWGTAGL